MPAGNRPRSRRPRGSLLPEQILDAAEKLVEDRGLEQLTMPAIARAIGAATTSVYWHFRTRDDLIVALTEAVTAKIHDRLPDVDATRPWNEEAFAYFSALRHELLHHPAYLTLFSVRPRFLFAHAELGSSLLQRLEQEIALFHQAGFSPAEAARAYNACSTYVRGFCMIEYGFTHEAMDDGSGAQRGVDAQFDAERFPTLSGLDDFERAMSLDEEEFALGLGALLDGLRALLRERATPTTTGRLPRRRGAR